MYICLVKDPQKPYISVYQRKVTPLPRREDPEYGFLLSELSESNVFIFPEYFSLYPEVGQNPLGYSVFTGSWLENLSKEPQAKNSVIIGGTRLVLKNGNLSNVSEAYYNGKVICSYEKRNLFGKEIGRLQPGKAPSIFVHPATQQKWGLLICADVKIPGIFTQYQGANYLAIPTASPFLSGDTLEAQTSRDKGIYIKGAKEAKAVIFKSCSTGKVASSGTISSVQGRSLIASGHTIEAKAPNINWEGVLRYDTRTQKAQVIPFENE